MHDGRGNTSQLEAAPPTYAFTHTVTYTHACTQQFMFFTARLIYRTMHSANMLWPRVCLTIETAKQIYLVYDREATLGLIYTGL